MRTNVAQSVSDWGLLSSSFPFLWGSIHEGIRADKSEFVGLGGTMVALYCFLLMFSILVKYE